MKTKRDASLEEIWAIRRQVAKQFARNPQKQVAHYQRKQKELGAKLFKRENHLAAAK